ncbi:MAG: SAM-dependent methyltransferase [Ornithinimicrobium sp.]
MAIPALPWREAWQQALYSDYGYYRRENSCDLGFSTSVHGVPHASRVIARAVIALADRHGLDTVIDIGAHRAALAEALDQIGSSLRYIGVDVTGRPPHVGGITQWWQAPGGAVLPDELDDVRDALVLAHEWLDVVPAVVAARGPGGDWHEMWVDPQTGTGRLGPSLGPDDEEWLQQWVGPDVAVAEVGRSRDEALRQLLDRVTHGLIVVIDYGHHRHARPVDGSLRGYQRGRRVDPVPDGSMDLTADVAIDSLLAAVAPDEAWAEEQRDALHGLLGPAMPPTTSMSRTDPQGYLAALAESGALAALTSPQSFGGFWWVCVDRSGVG